jgi:hypothetical protein
MSHQVLGLRGYLQYVQSDTKLSDAAKVAKISEVLALAQRPEEKRLVIAALGAVPAAGSLELLTTLAADPAVAEEAYSALVNLASKDMPGVSREQRREALQRVMEKSENDATKRRAGQGLRRVR